VPWLSISGNTFQNLTPFSSPISSAGYGIRALDTDMFLMGNANTFIGLFTGIEASATVATPTFFAFNQVFESCFNGIRVSACPSPLIMGCSFELPNLKDGSAVPTALSILNLNSFVAQGNTILGNGMGYGVYLESINGGAGQVWANTIEGLSVGVMAQGITASGSLGGFNTIQVQCNQFDNNSLSDILVTGVGLSSIQGTENVSASNKFGKSSFHIISENMPITYYGYEGPYFPTRVEGRITVLEARELANCNILIGSKDAGLQSVSDAGESLALAQNLLVEMQDMGSTDDLLAEVEGASGNDPLALRDALMEKSPMLSDTVMVRTSDDEVPLPNIMLAQVLMSNPQAAKSSAVLDALEARENALPAYLIEAILESGTSISPIDVVKSVVANQRATRDMVAGILTHRFASDTLGKQYDSLQMLKDYHPDLIYQYISAFAAREMGDAAGAQQQLNDMGVNNTLTPTQVQELSGVTTLANLLDAAGEDLLALDSTARVTLLGIVDQSSGIASALAHNLLAAMDTIPFLAQAYVLDRNTGADAPTAHGPYVEVEPYPVTRFVVVHYDMGGITVDHPYLSIKSQKGKTAYQHDLTRAQFELLVEVDGWLPGLYSVNLMDKKQTLARTSFVIEGAEQVEVDSNPAEDIAAPIVSVYPNPTSGMVSIEVKGDRELLFSYEVFTQVGVRVLSGNGSGSKQLSLANLGKGSFMVTVNVNGTRHTFSVVVE
ncbi:MAG: T9SS type A sorting domain-containing protein, partial [Bacteroidales bacterium]|nr:T9SS type A sorting domain-containing protein [Bacteroidales bacterium]